MGLNDKVVETILYASPMDDVGKIGLPDHILLKPGKLDPDERGTMKQRAIIGEKILEGADSGFLKLAEVIALAHPEKGDGGGCPLDPAVVDAFFSILDEQLSVMRKYADEEQNLLVQTVGVRS